MKNQLFFLSFSTFLASLCIGFNSTALAKEYDPTTGYEIVQSGEWRSAKDRIPWSRPVLLEDEFTGEQTLAVYGKNYDRNIWRENERGHFSLWRADGYINVYSYDSVKTCPEILWCGRKETRTGAVKVEIKVGNQVFEAEKSGIEFKLPSDIGLALAMAENQKEEILVRAAFEDLGQSMTWRMGPKTVTALSEIFAESLSSERDSFSLTHGETGVMDPVLIDEPEGQGILMIP